MKKSTLAGVVASAALLALSASGAFADLLFVSAESSGSFTLAMQVNEGTFNNLKISVPSAFSHVTFPVVVGGSPTFSGRLEAVPGPTFASPEAGWGTYTLVGDDDLSASGTSFTATNANLFDFSLMFDNDITDGATFDIVFFNDTNGVKAYHVSYYEDGGLDRFGIVEYAVPLPPAVWSGLAMMAGFGVFLAKRRRDRKVLS